MFNFVFYQKNPKTFSECSDVTNILEDISL